MLSPGEALARSVVTTLLLLVMMFVLNVTVFSHLQHLASQQRLRTICAPSSPPAPRR